MQSVRPTFRLEPAKLGHVLSRDAFAPSSGFRVRQVHERTFGERRDRLNALPKRCTESGRESGADLASEHQLLALVIANQKGVEVPPIRPVPADDEFLLVVNLEFYPGAPERLPAS